MSISKFNHEGYFDPTTYEALSNIETEARKARFRPVVYVCSPFSGDPIWNAEKARRYCRFAVDIGYAPFAPHLFFPQFLDDNDAKQRDLGLYMANVLLTKCSEVWVFGRRISSGMAAEIYKAETRGMPIRYFTEEMEEVKSNA